jgi:phosphatidate cytidylyltransferase
MMNNSNVSEFFKRLITGIILLICFAGSYLHSSLLYQLFLGAILILILFYEWPQFVCYKRIDHIFYTLLYPISPIILLLWLTQMFYTTDPYLPLYPFFVAWSADTCGYFVGKLIGRHKMCPAISPGKSWEGLMGSWIGVFVMHLLIIPRITLLSSTIITHNILTLFAFSGVMTMVAFWGGFFLSYLKRTHNLKDAGTILPGHGGFLDRFDSVFFVTPVTVLLVLIFQ